MKTKDFPEIIEIELTSKCNKNCNICQRHWFTPKHVNNDLNSKLLDLILDQTNYRDCQINLGGLGESLLCDKLPELLFQIKYYNNKIITGINTNGILLTEDKYSWLTDGRLDYFTISLNASDEASYQFLVGDNDYISICENAKKFLLYKGKTNKPFTTVHCFNAPICKNSIDKFNDFWQYLADFIQIRKLSNFCGTVPIENFGVEPDYNGICERPFVSLAIDSNGIYNNCCGNFYLDNSNTSVNDCNIYNYWNSHDMAEMRNFMINGNFPNNHVCIKCSAKSILPNTLIEKNG
jgi:hypothetical protein